MSENSGLTKQQWANIAGGGFLAWLVLSFAGVPVVGGLGAVVAVVGGVQYLRLSKEG